MNRSHRLTINHIRRSGSHDLPQPGRTMTTICMKKCISQGAISLYKPYKSFRQLSSLERAHDPISALDIQSIYHSVRQSNATSASTNPLFEAYLSKVALNIHTNDMNQHKMLKYLDRLSKALENSSRDAVDSSFKHKVSMNHHSENKSEHRENLSTPSSQDESLNVTGQYDKPTQRLRGVYIYGNVGTGKTMLMDLFYHNCQISRKLRIHYHQFMLNIHKDIFALKKVLSSQGTSSSSGADAVTQVALKYSEKYKLICLDEFQVTDIYDAMILLRIFDTLWSNGTVLVSTSNRHPNELYQNGLNRQYFLPFIERLKAECIVRDISSDKDYRSMMVGNETDVYYHPLSKENSDKLLSQYNHEISNKDVNIRKGTELSVMMGRVWPITNCSIVHRTCWLEFDEVCHSNRGAADYKALCTAFDTIYLHNVPHLNILQHNIARRFITFIDEVYDAKVRLLWTAASPPQQLFQELTTVPSDENVNHKIIPDQKHHIRGENTDTHKIRHTYVSSTSDEEHSGELLLGELSAFRELGFAFKRAASRLQEISSKQYLQDWINNKK